jgi:UV DNA damage endonuclease
MPALPHLGLVCITDCEDIRYKALTRTRFLKLAPADQSAALRTLYAHNVGVLQSALTWCANHGVPLYRVTSNLFPFSDEPLGIAILHEMAAVLARVGAASTELGIRVVVHPDQFVVLSSDEQRVIANSITILKRHALAFDLMGLPRSPWAAINLHGGKGDRQEKLVATILALPENIRSRLTLENDERAYSAPQIHAACVAAGVPMVFDAHHHLVKEKLSSYDDPTIARWTATARATWAPHESWQIVHLSNGAEELHDNAHHDTITRYPAAFRPAEGEDLWVEIEAKRKETAIAAVRKLLARPAQRRARSAKGGPSST